MGSVIGGYDIVDESDNIICARSKVDGRYNTHKEVDDNFFNLELIWLHNRLIHCKYSSHKFIEGIVHEDQFWNLDIYNRLNHIVNINLSTYKYVSRKASYSRKSQFKRAFIDDGLILVKRMVKTDNKNWITCAESMAVSTIIKNLYIGKFDSKYRKSVVQEIYSSGIFPVKYINIASFARFQKIMYNLLLYPDWIRYVVAKGYLYTSKLLNREI